MAFIIALVVILSSAYLSSATYLPRCSPLHPPQYGSLTPVKYHYSIGNIVRFSCESGFSLKGNALTKCVLGSGRAVWRYPAPTCEREYCVPVIIILNSTPENLEYFYVCSYQVSSSL